MSRFRKIKKKKGKKKMTDKKQPEGPQPQPGPTGQPIKVIGTVTIDVYEDMNVNVRGFPTDHTMSVLVIGNALLAVNNWFAEQAQKNKAQVVLAKPVPKFTLEEIEKIKRNN